MREIPVLPRILTSLALAATLAACAEDDPSGLPQLQPPDELLPEVETSSAARVGGCVISEPPAFGGVATGIASDSLRDGVTNIAISVTGEDTAVLGNVRVDRFDRYRFDGEPTELALVSTEQGATAHVASIDIGFLGATPIRLIDADVTLTFGDSPQVVDSVQVTGALTFANANRVYLDVIGDTLGNFIYADGHSEDFNLDTDGDSVADAWRFAITLSNTSQIEVVTP